MLVLQSLLLSVGIEALAYLKSIVVSYLYDDDGTSGPEEKNIIEISSQKTCVTTLDELGLRFWPPLYMQRYMAVQEILEHPIWNGSIKKVVDFGCAELGMFKCIKPVPGLNNIMLVDIDFSLLDLNQTKVLPTNYDHLSMSERKEPLTVDIYNGSIADLDDRMLGVDAVICVELIEHLHSDVLNAVPHTVFEFIRPALALFTTPNVEFNILFPNFHTEFRHDDHKFEWTRKQLKDWARKITSCYPDYAVQFDGIGAAPYGGEKLGCCSQMAIFYRKDMKTSPAKPIGCTPYKLLRRVSYPFELHDENVRERTIYDKLIKFVTEARFNHEYLIDDSMEIPLNVILPHISDCCSSINELEKFANKLYCIKKNDQGELVLLTDAFESSSDEYKSDTDSYSNHSGQYSLLENTEEWDNNKDIDLNETVNLSFSESRHCYSTPMTNNQKPNVYFSNIDSFSTVCSSSDLYKTAADHDMSCNEDMEITSSSNGSIVVDNCKMYQEFLTGRFSSTIDEEDIKETEKTLTCESNCDDNDIENGNALNDNTIVIQNSSNSSLKKSYTTDTVCSSSDLYKTAVDHDMNCNEDMEITFISNGSIVVDNCKMYQEFLTGRNSSSIDKEDIRETEKTLTCKSNCDNKDIENGNALNDNTIVIQNSSNSSLKRSYTSDTTQEPKSKHCNNFSNYNEENIEFEQPSVFLHRSLLDENDLTEKLLSIPDNEL